MKNEIWVSFNYGAWSLVFSKTIDLPFTPFLGLGLIINDEKEYEVKFENNDYCKTLISYNLEKNQFEINVRNVWKRPVSDETIDYVIEMFSDWERHDQTNVVVLKELMSREYSNNKRMSG